ncbi:MAG: hypothetical protein KDC87_16110 [Planctomycetes bacterium]|nr:hypothetical protein [Planctomycetota bacterium]
MLRSIFPALTLFLCSVASAQSLCRTAHPQDEPHVNTGQSIPFGAHFASANGRSQLLFPAHALPGPGAVLRGIEIRSMDDWAVTYKLLQVTVSPIAANAQLSPLFDANLPKPTLVYRAAPLVRWDSTRWQRFDAIAFNNYLHDGTTALVLDIRKSAVPGYGVGSTGLVRDPASLMMVAYGDQNSNANNATVATVQVIPIDVRLLWSAAPTLHLSSPVPAAGHHGFAVGSFLDVAIDGAPGSPTACLIDVALRPPVALPPFMGQLHVRGFRIPTPPVDSSGSARVRLPIPNSPQLVGVYLVLQGALRDAQTGALQLTNAADAVIGS